MRAGLKGSGEHFGEPIVKLVFGRAVAVEIKKRIETKECWQDEKWARDETGWHYRMSRMVSPKKGYYQRSIMSKYFLEI